MAQYGKTTLVEYKSDHSAFMKCTWLIYTKSFNHALLEPWVHMRNLPKEETQDEVKEACKCVRRTTNWK